MAGVTLNELTTDGLKAYLIAVDRAFENEIDYAQLVKMYGGSEGTNEQEKKYSPAECTGIKKKRISGDPEFKFVSTSYVERQNLSMRMSMRRFTRLTNAFSKKIENHGYAIALYFVYYNFCRIHSFRSKRVQCDEIWSFVGSKEQGHGDAWTWTAIDADSKLIISWLALGLLPALLMFQKYSYQTTC
jgi:IS1 family transposase